MDYKYVLAFFLAGDGDISGTQADDNSQAFVSFSKDSIFFYAFSSSY
jgi:hypothetical protein